MTTGLLQRLEIETRKNLRSLIEAVSEALHSMIISAYLRLSVGILVLSFEWSSLQTSRFCCCKGYLEHVPVFEHNICYVHVRHAVNLFLNCF